MRNLMIIMSILLSLRGIFLLIEGDLTNSVLFGIYASVLFNGTYLKDIKDELKNKIKNKETI